MIALLRAVPVWAYALALVLAGWAFTGYKLNSQVAKTEVAKNQVLQMESQLARQKVDAAKTLAEETQKVTTVESKLSAALLTQQSKDNENGKTITTLEQKLATASSANAGRLRDPNAKPSAGCGISGGSSRGSTTASAPTGAANATETSGLFSEPATRLFQRITREADEINSAYASCRADSFTAREIVNGVQP